MRESFPLSRLTDHYQIHGGAVSSSYTTVNYILGEIRSKRLCGAGSHSVWQDQREQMNFYEHYTD